MLPAEMISAMALLTTSRKLSGRFLDGIFIGMVLTAIVGLAYEFLLH